MICPMMHAYLSRSLGVDAGTHEIVAAELTPDGIGDVSELPCFLDQIDAEIASLTADGAYDSEAIYDEVADHHLDTEVIIPPRATAVPNEITTTQRNRHIACSKSMDAWAGSAVPATI